MFPDQAETLLLDRYLIDRDEASARLFRVYQPAPAHFHRHSNEHLLALSGRGRTLIWAEAGADPQAIDFAPGTLLCFERNIVHATTELFEHPVVFLAIDAPRRDPADVIYVDPRDGDSSCFIREV